MARAIAWNRFEKINRQDFVEHIVSKSPWHLINSRLLVSDVSQFLNLLQNLTKCLLIGYEKIEATSSMRMVIRNA